MSQSNSTVETSIDFLERNEIWGREKPFLLDYVPEPPAIKSNAVIENRPVSIDDIRGHEKDFSFAKNGFSIFPLKTQLLPEDFDDNTKVEQVHVQEVAEALKVLLEADRVQIYDYTVRKREASFPHSTGGHYAHKQPASVAHIDLTPACMKQMLYALNPAEEAESFIKRHCQSVNVWRPIRGPIRDWPLALCDPRSLELHDLQPRDTVSRGSFVETFQVHHTLSQRWYYMSNQTPDEAWVFLQADSVGAMPGVPHAAFRNTLTGDGNAPRESIEIRCMVYYNE